jgi:hypothetical protein
VVCVSFNLKLQWNDWRSATNLLEPVAPHSSASGRKKRSCRGRFCRISGILPNDSAAIRRAAIEEAASLAALARSWNSVVVQMGKSS